MCLLSSVLCLHHSNCGVSRTDLVILYTQRHRLQLTPPCFAQSFNGPGIVQPNDRHIMAKLPSSHFQCGSLAPKDFGKTLQCGKFQQCLAISWFSLGAQSKFTVSKINSGEYRKPYLMQPVDFEKSTVGSPRKFLDSNKKKKTDGLKVNTESNLDIQVHTKMASQTACITTIQWKVKMAQIHNWIQCKMTNTNFES